MEVTISDEDSETSDLSAAEEDFFPLIHVQKMINIKKNITVLVISNINQVSNNLLYNINQVFIIK